MLKMMATFGSLVWKAITVSAFFGMFAIVLLQIFSRYVFDLPTIWTDEVAQLAFIWMIYIGVLGPVRNNDMIRMDILSSFLGARVRRVFEVGFQIVMVVVCAVMAPGAYRLFTQTMHFEFNAIPIPYAALYIAGLAFFALAVPVCLWKVLEILRSGRDAP